MKICKHKIVDAPENGYDYNTINNSSINLDGVDFESHDNFMDAISHKYDYIYCFFISELFHKYSGIDDSLEILLSISNRLNMLISKGTVISNGYKGDHFGGGGEIMHFTSYKDMTTITDYSNEVFSSGEPISITLPTTDFLKIVENLIKQKEKSNN